MATRTKRAGKKLDNAMRTKTVRLKPLKLPASYDTPCGPVTIVGVDEIPAPDGEVTYGRWCWGERRIEIVNGLSAETQWFIFHHEVTHQQLEDGGVRLPDDQLEQVCDCIAQARVAAMRSAGV